MPLHIQHSAKSEQSYISKIEGSRRRIGWKRCVGERGRDRRALPKVFASPSIFHANSNEIGRRANDYFLQMLQRAMWSQLARIDQLPNTILATCSQIREKKTLIDVNYPGPLKATRNHVNRTLEMLPPGEKHWFSGGLRSIAVAVEYLEKKEVIAVPTDTIYGLAALAQNNEAIDKIYAIKGREKTKPLAITLSSVRDIKNWAEIDHVPFRLLTDLLPGPVTVVLKRKKNLNPALNEGHDSVGIRVPRSKFIRHVCKMIGEPLALTSANLSNEPSSLHPDEFSALWPRLAAIFYDIPRKESLKDSQRVGSTVVDLTTPGKFKILRKGVRFHHDIRILKHYVGPVEEEKEQDDELVEDDIAVRESLK